MKLNRLSMIEVIDEIEVVRESVLREMGFSKSLFVKKQITNS